RARGRLDAAAAVARTGAERHPDLPEAHDLYARVLSDAGNDDAAREAWEAALAKAPRHLGALKGLAYLAYRGADPVNALELLETALSVDPTDASVLQALTTVRAAVERLEGEARVRAGADIFAGFEGAEHGLLLVDEQGLILGGALRDGRGRDLADEVGAHVAGAAGEARRAARLLDLGEWQALVVEASEGHLHVSPPAAGAVLLVKRERSLPAGRLALAARRAATAARAWLEAQRP
ncbi:MAG TPA: roadblock/LC7 domain-containing protein, partial [Gemmatimonadales bacterium]|nr:roadblock/LC7 domain-containing protein [Gemmatimonadales bacterium]